MLESVRAEAKPTGASHHADAATASSSSSRSRRSATARRASCCRFPNVRSQAPADVFVGRGPVSVVHVATTGVVPTTRVTVDLLRPATYRVIPPEEGEKEFTILFEEDVPPLVTSAPPNATGFVASLDPIDALLTRGGLGAAGALGATGAVGAFSASGASAATGVRGAKAGPFGQVPQQGAIPQLPPQTPMPTASAPAAVHRSSGDARFPGRRSADGAADVRRHQRPQHRHRSVGAGRGRRLAARSAVGSGARHHPARSQTGLLGRGHDRADRAAGVAGR